MAIRYLDGSRLQRAFIAAANRVNARRDHLNAINVFPVPDGDTGTNMAATLAYAADGIAHLDRPSLREVREALGRAVLVGARGNSGFILAQFLRGFLEGVGEGVRRIHPGELARATQQAVRRAYEAIRQPVEGTIITVMREWSVAVARLSAEVRDLREIFDGALERATEALEQTREQMTLLREHGVVDAGAQGFVHMLEGISQFLRDGDVHSERPESVTEAPGSVVEAAGALGDLTFRYCTQVLMENVAVPVEGVTEKLDGWGDSLIVSGDAGLLKIHVHTDRPQEMVAMLSDVGTVLESKAEDMQVQAGAVAARKRFFTSRTERQTVGIVLDSTCDLDLDTAASYGIAVIPCLVAFGEETYRDKYELTFDRFYDLLRTHPTHPVTSMPAVADYHEVYETALQTHDEVLSVHVAEGLSGTFGGAVTAAREVDPDRITVVDSGTLCVALGCMGIQLARLARKGASMRELVHRLEEMKLHSRLYAMLESIEYVIKGGRISRIKGWIGQTLGLLPILTAHAGSLDAIHHVRGTEKGVEFVFDRLAEEIPEGAPVIGVTAHAQNPEMVARIEERFRRMFHPDEMMEMCIGPAIGSHAGPGAWGIFYLIGSAA